MSPKFRTSAFCFILFILGYYNVFCQSKSHNYIEGTVTDENKEPLILATVMIKGAKTGVLTDANGHYKLQVPDSLLYKCTDIVYRYVGLKTFVMNMNAENLPIVINAELTSEDYLKIDLLIYHPPEMKKYKLDSLPIKK